ncbi:YsnF/AvaK domain-containing protein [Laspinema olomoucense]|uniref:YsnF/AvaK domain-containing protein n=1 Tax=Laspinema olomoucense TaxID=3231600 RepID=UPI0021BB6575|nr:YsnF/AvaK domain-containing protein [Laspinema sp. D3c]MCT7996430.1 YsnF/AvaK domain-containing protein [Laspinema sp. D3c]
MNDQVRERGDNLQSAHSLGELPARLDNLKSQLLNFTVRDSEGQPLGRVTDLTVEPENKLNLIVSRGDDRPSGLVKVSSDLIEKIEYATNTVFVLLTREQLDALPEYQTSPYRTEIDPSELPGEWVNPVSSPPSPGTLALEERSHQIDSPSSLADYNQIRKEVIASNIPLHEERLVVNRHKRKVGEVVVRKEIETRMIEVPVRREKLIVEQVSPEYKKLTEIILSEAEGYPIRSDEAPGIMPTSSVMPQGQAQNRVSGEFDSPEIAARILEEISQRQPNGCGKVRIELVVEEERFLSTYQSWLDSYSKPQS